MGCIGIGKQGSGNMGASDLCYAVWKSKSKMESANSKRDKEFVKPAHHKGWPPFLCFFLPNVIRDL